MPDSDIIAVVVVVTLKRDTEPLSFGLARAYSLASDRNQSARAIPVVAGCWILKWCMYKLKYDFESGRRKDISLATDSEKKVLCILRVLAFLDTTVNVSFGVRL